MERPKVNFRRRAWSVMFLPVFMSVGALTANSVTRWLGADHASPVELFNLIAGAFIAAFMVAIHPPRVTIIVSVAMKASEHAPEQS